MTIVSALLSMSQSPEGSTLDFHARFIELVNRRNTRCLNPPKGQRSISTFRCFVRHHHPFPGLNPPKGQRSISTALIDARRANKNRECLNPPKGQRSISTWNTERVRDSKRCLNPPKGQRSISARDGQCGHLDPCAACLNPPKGQRSISALWPWMNEWRHLWEVSQSPEGSALDFRQNAMFRSTLVDEEVSIPRRVSARFPLSNRLLGTVSFCQSVSIPRRVSARFPPRNV